MTDDSLFLGHLEKGDRLSKLHEFEDAIKCYDMALKIEPDNYKAWHNRGVALAQLHRYQEAVASFYISTSQPFSKRIVSQEELKRQLSEALPNAIQVAARAYGRRPKKSNRYLS